MHLLVAGWIMTHKIATYAKILLNSTLLVGEGKPGCVSPAGNSCEFCFAKADGQVGWVEGTSGCLGVHWSTH